MTDPLTTVEDAAEVLGMDEAELDAAVSEGTLRRVKHGDDVFILGADVDRALKDADPKHLAATAYYGESDPDDPESPSNLAAEVPRF